MVFLSSAPTPIMQLGEVLRASNLICFLGGALCAGNEADIELAAELVAKLVAKLAAELVAELVAKLEIGAALFFSFLRPHCTSMGMGA